MIGLMVMEMKDKLMMCRGGSLAVKKEKNKMDNRRHVEKALSVLETSKCDFLSPSERVPARVLFKYEGGSSSGGFSLISPFVSEDTGQRILSWLRMNADPEEFGCGLNHPEKDSFTLVCCRK
jgi:hypothetical protein